MSEFQMFTITPSDWSDGVMDVRIRKSEYSTSVVISLTPGQLHRLAHKILAEVELEEDENPPVCRDGDSVY